MSARGLRIRGCWDVCAFLLDVQLLELRRGFRERVWTGPHGRERIFAVNRARAAGLSWPLPEDLDDQAIEDKLFFKPEKPRNDRPIPDWRAVHRELRKNKHVTLTLLWQEYKFQHPDGYQYTQFCEHYRRWEGTLNAWMRQEHRGGEKLFVDFSGDGIPWINPLTGEAEEAPLFVAVLGASDYI